MSWVAVGVTAATVVTGAVANNQAKKAASAQQRGAEGAMAEQAYQYDQTRADLEPWRTTGGKAIGAINRLMGFPISEAPIAPSRDRAAADAERQFKEDVYYGRVQNVTPDMVARRAEENFQRESKAYNDWQGQVDPSGGQLGRQFSVDDFWQDPVTQLSYQAGLDEGKKALETRAPLTTGRDSGAMLKELTKFGTDYTSAKAGESYNRFENNKSSIFNRLAALAGIGQTANNTIATAGMNTANNNAQILTGAGNAQAASQIAGGNAWSGALGNIANWWNQQNTLNRLFPQGGGATPTSNFAYSGYGRAGDYQYG